MNNQTDRGQIGLAVLVVLAIVASIVMLIAGSDAALKIALLAALWAAVIGFFLVTRYRRLAQKSEDELAYREKLHQAELEKVQTAEEPEVLAEIREQLSTIRKQLEDLSGREFGYEPAALRAEARRIMELEDNFKQTSAGAPSEDAIAGRLGNQTPQETPLEEIIKEKQEAEEPKQEGPTFQTDSFQAVRWDTGGDPEVSKPKEEKRGRRRQDAHREGSVSVAELIAEMKKKK
ncbi:DUF6779 domain-containing protein [Corynebacterium sp. HMSC04H06]|uniref:DUF6779 domain-containing protein n=1 Tax=Corynebacterium sp. HMSC04H06 TaxID=1581050 RepID=UPI0008A31262|nr:DUF6779 domain-containing protein [Corynebacterium sp. HMSC04H06]OFS21949.1 hypothetical protein HMPREF3067_05240 [Corynebacterium sp. HMSC04H06]